MKTRRNILVTDMEYIDDWLFQAGLMSSMGISIEQVSMVSNKMRKGLYNLIRYWLYFYNPLKLFFKRKEYDYIFCWQAFYGIVLVFYYKLFCVRPVNKIILINFIYNPRKGLLGLLYYKWLKWLLNSDCVQSFISGSKTHCGYLHEQFGIPKNLLHFIPYCREDDSLKVVEDSIPLGGNYILGVGRSNRDWEWVIRCFRTINYKLVIICDELGIDKGDLTDNVTIINNVCGDEMLRYLKHSRCLISSFVYPKVASGEMVYVQGLCMSKPIIVTSPCCLTDDYVKDGVTGLVVAKKEQNLIDAIERIYTDERLYSDLCKNSRACYDNEHDLVQYGRKVGLAVISSAI